jgi:hypothetical protein
MGRKLYSSLTIDSGMGTVTHIRLPINSKIVVI